MFAVCQLQRHGYVSLHQSSRTSPVILSFDLFGFEPNSIHAVHIHEYGDLRDGCTSLGGHFNPTNKYHGDHAGDLFHNFVTDEEGKFEHVYLTNALSLFPGSKCIIGRSIVIHAFPDDYGEEGMYLDDEFYFYDEIDDTRELERISERLGYPITSREGMVEKLIQESRTTGNASTRIDCGVIGLSKN